jgi:riboflavin synthase
VFTGIVKEIGRVKAIARGTDIVRFEIECPSVRHEIGEGDSIAINGCDLTATELTPDGFRCDATKETLLKTGLGDLEIGAHVNIEPSLTLSTPISGHLVLGHIDGVGIVRSLRMMNEQAELTVVPPLELMKFIAQKGSITIDGVGLTVVHVTRDIFSCWIIPYTLTHTTLGKLKSGEKVNLEVDVLARYVVRALESGVKSGGEGITEDFLKEHGLA